MHVYVNMGPESRTCLVGITTEKKTSGKLFAQKLKISVIIRAVTQFHSFSSDKTFKKKDVKEIWNSFCVVDLVWGFTAAEPLSGDDRGFDADKIIGC